MVKERQYLSNKTIFLVCRCIVDADIKCSRHMVTAKVFKKIIKDAPLIFKRLYFHPNTINL